MSKKILIQTVNLTKKYKEFTAVNKANLTLTEGDIYGLIGKNGAGKTTLFKLIMGLAKPSSGDLIITNENRSRNLNLARKNIGFMIGSSFFSYLSAYQNIEYYRKLKGIRDPGETNRVLKIVELDREKKPFKTFSLGMKQRLGLANALLGSPSIIILDEPINGLDPQGISDMRNIIKEMNRQHGITFIISSHILSELDLVATTFGFIDQGVLLKELDHEEVHKLTQKSLIIHVDEAQRAAQVLTAQLGITNYEIKDQNEIVLDQFLDRPYMISKVLVEHGLQLNRISKQETTLEEYFIKLVGGEQDESLS